MLEVPRDYLRRAQRREGMHRVGVAIIVGGIYLALVLLTLEGLAWRPPATTHH